MSPLAFSAALPVSRARVSLPHSGATTSAARAPAVREVWRRSAPRAELSDLIPGVPPGEDARDNAPLRYYVPRPVETYDDRSFTEALAVTWAGEVPTIGAADVPEGLTKESVAEAKLVPEDAVSTGAFVEYARMMQAERAEALRALNESVVAEGRATCGEEEGRSIVSNYNKTLVEGVKCLEYWGVQW